MAYLKAGLQPQYTDPIMERVAFETLGVLVEATPKKWTGLTRRGWVVEKIPKGYQVINRYKVMQYLEFGTRDHGPKNKKFLYIPLRSGAMIWRRGLVYGKDYVLARRVKGIKARNIVYKERPKARKRTLDAMVAYLRQLIYNFATEK